MKIKPEDFSYGAALAQIVEQQQPFPTLISRVGEKEGFYGLNDRQRLLMKFSTANTTGSYNFDFPFEDVTLLQSYAYEIFLVLICLPDSVCLLDLEDVKELLRFASVTPEPQWIRVTCPEDGPMTVESACGFLAQSVPHERFPGRIFQEIEAVRAELSWPPESTISIDLPSGYSYSVTTNNHLSRFDLADNVAFEVDGFGDGGSTVIFSLSTPSAQWSTWTEENLCRIEELLAYDLNFDGFDVAIKRVSENPADARPCTEDYTWELYITEAGGDDDSAYE